VPSENASRAGNQGWYQGWSPESPASFQMLAVWIDYCRLRDLQGMGLYFGSRQWKGLRFWAVGQ
jgi:hypothetical protein